MTFDAHVHPTALFAKAPEERAAAVREPRFFCASCHTESELHDITRFKAEGMRCITGFGIHPEEPDLALFPVLERAAREGSIQAVGECGFDRVAARDDAMMAAQREVFRLQAVLAREMSLPLVIHLRKAMDILFAEADILAELPSVIFHNWPGSPEEGVSLLKRGMNAYFSSGIPLIRGRKVSVKSCLILDGNRLLAETDAPWMPPAGQPVTRLCRIDDVIRKMASVRGIDAETMQNATRRNFMTAFGLEIHDGEERTT